MSVEDSAQRYLGDLPDEVGSSVLAATVLELARQMDDSSNSATSKSMCGKAILDIMSRLSELAPPKEMPDGISRIADELAERRNRVARGAAASDPAGS